MKATAAFCLFAFAACLGLCSCASDDRAQSPAAKPGAKTSELRGRIAPGQPPHFKTDAGEVYTLVSNRTSAALFIDTNLLSKTLLLKGKVLPQRRFEVTGNLHSIKDGKVQELYYYCDVCAIKGIDPGPCMCCQEPVHLVEKPVK